MAHFAEINAENKVVRVLRVPNSQEHRGSEYLAQDLGLGGTWIQTSYNTRANKHKYGKTPLRKNHPGVGYTYDPARDAFIPPKPSPDWILHENTCTWVPPKPFPSWNYDEDARGWRAPVRPGPGPAAEGKKYKWDENTLSWIQVPINN